VSEQLENSKLSKDKLASLFFNEYQYRHSLLWSTIKFYIIIIASLYAYPMFSINADDIQKFNFRLIIFPISGFLITFIGWWHIRSEADRFDVVYKKYNEIRGQGNRPTWLYTGKRSFIQQLISESMNKLILSLYFILSLIFFLFGTLMIVDYCFFENQIHPIMYLSILPIPILFIIKFLVTILFNMMVHNKKTVIKDCGNCIKSTENEGA